MYAFDRQPNESTRAYAAARIYFELGAERSLEAVSKECGKNVSLLTRWSSRWRWVERAAAYDAWLAEAEHEARLRAVGEAEREWAERRAQLRQNEWAEAERLIATARQMLATPLFEDVVVAEHEEMGERDGEPVRIVQQTIHRIPTNWRKRDVVAYIKLAMELRRNAANLPPVTAAVQARQQDGTVLSRPDDITEPVTILEVRRIDTDKGEIEVEEVVN